MNKTWIVTGILNLITAMIHTIVGQIKLVNPFLEVEFAEFLKAILLSCWHMVTAILFLTTIIFFVLGMRPKKYASSQISFLIGVYYTLATLAFTGVSLYYGLFLFQIPLLGIIAILAFWGCKCSRADA